MFVPLTPIRFLHRAMELFPRKVGVICGERQFTYQEFGERCRRLAAALQSWGMRPGDRVAYLSFNNHQLLEGYYGVIQARGIIVPLNVRLTAAELADILNHAGARLLLYEHDFDATVDQLRRDCPNIEEFLPLDEHYESWLSGAEPAQADIFAYDEKDIAELFYTSGSTGAPKGVMLSHRTLYLHALDIAPLFPEVEPIVDLHTIPLFHANGWGRPQMSVMLGFTQVMVRRFDPTTVFGLIQKHGATHMCLVPTMANALLNAPDREAFDLRSLRQVMIGGTASSPELIERMERTFGCECLAGYGLTETTPVLTTGRPKTTVAHATEMNRYRRQAMAGWPVPGVEVRVVDQHLRDVPRDMTKMGEVVTRGDHVMEGYFREPEQTAAAMTDGWFHTGDMAVWDEEGFIHIVDRKKEIIISGGENISSLEIEKLIAAHEAVYECAVVAAPDEKWGEVPAAFVVRKTGMSLTEEELLEFLGERLSRFKLPRILRFQDEPLPKTGTGKIRKLLLKEQFWAGKDKRVQG